MKVSELRIGSLVLDNKSGDVQTITAVARNYVYISLVTEVTRALDEIEGVPLTEEWLLKFGFKNREMKNNTWSFPDLPFIIETERNIVMLNGKIISICANIHSLQNLYFALTSEELTIKEK